MSRWKVCAGGIVGFILFASICYMSLRQVEKLSGMKEPATPDVRYMDMSSIANESPAYVESEENGNVKGIYNGSNLSVTEEIDLTACSVSEPLTGMIYLENVRAAACSGELKNMIDWTKVPEGKRGEAERVLQVFMQEIDAGKECYVIEQWSIDNGLIVQFMMMDMLSGTTQGRLYDYDHATVLAFTFLLKENNLLVVPVSIL